MNFPSGDSRTHRLPSLDHQGLGKYKVKNSWREETDLETLSRKIKMALNFRREQKQTPVGEHMVCTKAKAKTKTNEHLTEHAQEEIPQQPPLLVVKVCTMQFILYLGKVIVTF